MLERTIVGLSLKYHVLSRFTAYVAVDRSQTVNRGALHQLVQPVEMPQGWQESVMMTAPTQACAMPASAPGKRFLYLGKHRDGALETTLRIEDVKLVVGRAERCEEILCASPWPKAAESRPKPKIPLD